MRPWPQLLIAGRGPASTFVELGRSGELDEPVRSTGTLTPRVEASGGGDLIRYPTQTIAVGMSRNIRLLKPYTRPRPAAAEKPSSSGASIKLDDAQAARLCAGCLQHRNESAIILYPDTPKPSLTEQVQKLRFRALHTACVCKQMKAA